MAMALPVFCFQLVPFLRQALEAIEQPLACVTLTKRTEPSSWWQLEQHLKKLQ